MGRKTYQSNEEFKEELEKSKNKKKNPAVVAAIIGVTFVLCVLMTWYAGNLDPLLQMIGL